MDDEEIISDTSRGHLSRKYFPIASVDREKSDNHNFMAFALKGTVLKIVKEKVIISLRSRSLRNAASRALRHEQVY